MHALSVRVGRAVKHLVGDGGLSMRVVPRIRMIIRPGIRKLYSGTFFMRRPHGSIKKSRNQDRKGQDQR